MVRRRKVALQVVYRLVHYLRLKRGTASYTPKDVVWQLIVWLHGGRRYIGIEVDSGEPFRAFARVVWTYLEGSAQIAQRLYMCQNPVSMSHVVGLSGQMEGALLAIDTPLVPVDRIRVIPESRKAI